MQPLSPDIVILGFVWYVVFLFSTTCHEASHALAAKLGGDPTASHGGQASLNPFPHVRREPLGMVVVPLVSYALSQWMIGWASAPYDPAWQQRYPRRAAWMALAGPAANFSLMLLAALAIRMGLHSGAFRVPETLGLAHIVEASHGGDAAFAATALSILFALNLLLGTFNLLPVPPLDGHTGVTLLMPERTALRFLDWFHRSNLGLLGLLIAWLVFGRIFSYVLIFALRLLYSGAV